MHNKKAGCQKEYVQCSSTPQTRGFLLMGVLLFKEVQLTQLATGFQCLIHCLLKPRD